MNIPTLAVISVFVITPSGGVVVGGTSPVTAYVTTPLTWTPAGGVLVGGGAPVGELVSGGVQVGGEATISDVIVKVYNIATTDSMPQLGVLVGGEAVVKEAINFIPTSGVKLGGAATVKENIPFKPTGGVLAGGASPYASVAVFPPSGGVLAGGAAPTPFGFTFLPTGGVQVAGAAANSSRAAYFLPTGGVGVSGSATAYSLRFGESLTAENPYNIPFFGWALNLDTAAPSRYKDLPANSITMFNGITYISCDAGIYALDADTDAGRPINAKFSLPKLDFGYSADKKVPVVYVGSKVDAKLKLRVTVNKNAPLYYEFADSRVKTGTVHGMRATTGKASIGRYWQFTIENINGADFEIDTVELNPVKCARRGA